MITMSSLVKTAVMASAVCGSLALLLAGYLKRRREIKALENSPPGTLGLWGIGEFISFVWDPVSFNKTRIEKYGLNHRSHLLFAPVIRCGTVEDRQRVLRSEMKGEAVNSWPNHWVELLGHHSTAVVTGERHAFLRKFFQSAFTPEILKLYVTSVDQCVCDYLERANDRKFHSSRDEFKPLAFAVIMRTIFGSNMDHDVVREFSNLFTMWTNGLAALIPFNIPFTAYGNAIWAKKRLMTMTEQIVRDCPKDANHLLAKFVSYRDENDEGMTMEEISENVFLLMFAGHDTTAGSFSSMISILFDPANANTLSRLRKEVKNIQPRDDAALRANEFLCAVIDEMWRKVPPILSNFRLATQNIELSDGYVVPKDTKMGIYMHAGHYDVQVWGNPDTYDPERFLKMRNEKSEAVRSYFYPFGGGNRLCPGELLARLELRTFVYRLARDWSAEVVRIRAEPFPIGMVACDFRLTHL